MAIGFGEDSMSGVQQLAQLQTRRGLQLATVVGVGPFLLPRVSRVGCAPIGIIAGHYPSVGYSLP